MEKLFEEGQDALSFEGQETPARPVIVETSNRSRGISRRLPARFIIQTL